MTRLERALFRLSADLHAMDRSWALIGGLAINTYADPRTTQDIDITVAVGSDREAEALVRKLRDRDYRVVAVVEQEAAGRLATARLETVDTPGVPVDIMFASSGIESEVADLAERIEILPAFHAPVARIGHLIALKVLAARDIDRRDVHALLAIAKRDDIALAQGALVLIASRGFARGRDLAADFRQLLGAG